MTIRPASPAPVSPSAATPDQLLIGASWYPEMWPESQWPQDIAKMRQLGFRIVRLFEFAWHKFEPHEGRFDFVWARRCLDQLHAAGIQVMLGTPTAAPPAWLTSTYPETLQTHPDGRRATHGQRKHYSVYSRKYRALCRSIVGQMATHLGSHPAVHSWQIDNEMGGSDFGPEALQSFHAYLQERYGTIEALNQVWGLEFWSQAYTSFDQIPMPIASVGSIEIPERHHPSLIMAVARHRNDLWESFIREQADTIRSATKAHPTPITTNMTPGLGMHWYQHNRCLDRVGFSMYRDVLHYHWNIMNFDRMRAEKDYLPYYLLETAPSWSAGGKMWNIHHDGRGINAMSWMSTLLGGSMILFWQWREHWAGQEMLHGTLVTATGQWRPNKDAIAKLCADSTAQESWLMAHPPQRAQVALALSHEASWAFSIDPMDDDMRYDNRWRDDYHVPLCRAHIWRDVIDETHDLSPYKILLLPLMPQLKADTRQRLKAWVQAGGHLIIGPLTGYRTDEFAAFTDQTFGGLEELFGATSALRFTVHWVEERCTIQFAQGPLAGQSCHTKNWCEAFAPTTATVLAHYHGGYGDALPAVLQNQYAQGTVTTVGCKLPEDLYLALVRDRMAAAGVAPVAAGSPHVLVVPRADATGALAGYGVVNLSEEPQKITLPRATTDRLTGRGVPATVRLAPLEVLVLEAKP